MAGKVIILGLLLFLTLSINQVRGHAKLITPVPLNTNAVTRQPCGVETMPTGNNRKISATWAAGSSQTLQWNLIAGDGGVSVSGRIDPNGGTNFSVDAWSGLKPHGTDVGKTYPISFTVPSSLRCNPVCTLKVQSNVNNWVSCAFINVTTCDDCPPPPPPPPVCEQANNLGFCTMRNKKNVQYSSDTTITALDQNAQIAFNTYIVNPEVFQNNGTECRQLFKSFLCSLNLPTCPGSGQTQSSETACRSMCREAMAACNVKESHRYLYDCDALPLCIGEENSASILSSSLAAAALATAAVLLN